MLSTAVLLQIPGQPGVPASSRPPRSTMRSPLPTATPKRVGCRGALTGAALCAAAAAVAALGIGDGPRYAISVLLAFAVAGQTPPPESSPTPT